MIIVKGENTFPRGKGWIAPKIFYIRNIILLISKWALPVKLRRDAQGLKRLCDVGILEKYSARKRIDEPGSHVRKGVLVHRHKQHKRQLYKQHENNIF